MKRILLYVSMALVLGLTAAAIGAANKDTESTGTKTCKVSVEPSNKAVCAMAPQTEKSASCPMTAARAGSADLAGSCDMGKAEAGLKCENKCPGTETACPEKATCENKEACPNKDDCPKKVK